MPDGILPPQIYGLFMNFIAVSDSESADLMNDSLKSGAVMYILPPAVKLPFLKSGL